MTAATSRLRRRGIGAGVAALVGLTGLGFAAVPASADATFNLTRPANTADRFETAASVALAAFPTGASNVIIANGDNAVDALAASYLAGTTTPVLYTQAGTLPKATLDAWTALKPTKTWVLGGTSAVSDAVYNSITGTKERISGADRYETAVNVGKAKAGTTAPTTAFIARGDQFADALAIAPVAAKLGIPVLLTETGRLNPTTAKALSDWGIKNVTIVGGPAAVSADVVAQLNTAGVTSTRVAGGTRTETATTIANNSAYAFGKTSVYLVNGFRPVDALPAAIAAAKANAPIILAEDGQLGADATGYLTTNKATLTSGVAVGGTAVLPASVETAAETAAGAPVPGASLQTLAVTPCDAASLETTATAESPNVTTDDRSYTVTGLTDATQYRITLVDAANISTTNGVASFAIDRTAVGVTSTNADGANGQQVSGNYLALPGTVSARFLSVNGGAPLNNAGAGLTTSSATGQTAVANPVNGSLTFTIDGDAPESVVPVVYVNGGAGLALTAGGTSSRLELNAAGVPVEAFGLGGATTYTALEAAAGAGSSLPITSVDKTANSFNATVSSVARRFDFDANDNFQLGGAPSTFAAFSAALSAGDTVTVNYGTDPASISTFDLADSNPALASGTSAAGTGNSSNDVTVTTTFTANSLDTITVERATVTGGVIGSYAAVGTITPTAAQLAAGSATFADNDLAAGTYSYRLTPVNDGDTGAQRVVSNLTVTTPSADTAAPLAIDSIVSTSAGLTGDLDSGDVVKVVFNEPLAAVAAGDTFRLSDGNSSVSDLVNGTNATFALNTAAETVNRVSRAAGTVLTVTLTGAPTVVTAGTTAGLQVPVTVADQSGTTDVAGNPWVPAAGSGATAQDIVISAFGADLANTSNDTTAPTVTAGTATTGATTVTFTADEPLDVSTVTAGDFAVTGTTPPTVSSVAVSSNGLTITVTLSGGLVAGNVVTLASGNVSDANGNATSAASVTAGAA